MFYLYQGSLERFPVNRLEPFPWIAQEFEELFLKPFRNFQSPASKLMERFLKRFISTYTTANLKLLMIVFLLLTFTIITFFKDTQARFLITLTELQNRFPDIHFEIYYFCISHSAHSSSLELIPN